MRNPFIISLVHPINLSMLALVIAAGLCAAWWLFPLGILVWIFMVFNMARDPSLQIPYQIKSRQPLAPRFESKFDRIENWQVKLYNTLVAAKPEVRKAFQPVQDEMNKLVNKVHELYRRNSALENYRLVNDRKEDLEAEWVTLNQEIEKTSDLSIRESLAQSLDTLETRMKSRHLVVTQLERVDAQMENVEKTLENVITEVLHLQAIGLDAINKDRHGLVDQLRKLSVLMDDFDGNQLKNNGEDFNPLLE